MMALRYESKLRHTMSRGDVISVTTVKVWFQSKSLKSSVVALMADRHEP